MTLVWRTTIESDWLQIQEPSEKVLRVTPLNLGETQALYARDLVTVKTQLEAPKLR
jgi:hypothetical protein